MSSELEAFKCLGRRQKRGAHHKAPRHNTKAREHAVHSTHKRMSTVIDMPLEMPPPVRRSLRSPSPPSKKRALEEPEEASSAYATRSKTIRTGEGLFDKEATPLDVMAEIDAAAAEEESEEDGEYAPGGGGRGGRRG